MYSTLFKSSRALRRRLSIPKQVALFVFVIMFLLSIRILKSNKDSRLHTERYKNLSHKHNIHKSSVLTLSELKERVKKENTDEFLVPVLRDYKFEEVDFSLRIPNIEDDLDEEIKKDAKRVKRGLGDGGAKAKLPDNLQPIADANMDKEAFNRLLSEMISPNRSVPDIREAACRSEIYDKQLPTASIVIIYINEAFSTLVRSIHSIINRTPAKYLKEIILVDDFSDHEHLKGKLERYIVTKFPLGSVRLVRLKKRAGLIRARMIGAHLAIGDVIIFLDAHIECAEMWAEPILQRIKEERTAVACPIIDVIDSKTMEYYPGTKDFFFIGGFSWSGHFTWIKIPPYEESRKKSHHSPTRSPTMAGGLFAIDRKYFWEIGSYDSDMELWGGENLEMSFRIWQCGGSVEVIPCSRVGHIFRKSHPYSFPNNVDSHGLNTARLVEVWMDEFKDLFYNFRKELKNADHGDVSKRIAFRKRKNCKSFKWYLDNIYKEQFQRKFSSKMYGQVKNNDTNQCLDNMQNTDTQTYQLSVYPCHPQLYPSQTFMLSNQNHLRRDGVCASSETRKNTVRMILCEDVHDKDTWELKDSQLRNLRTEKCLTVVTEDGKKSLELRYCMKFPNQIWTFNSYEDPANNVDEEITISTTFYFIIASIIFFLCLFIWLPLLKNITKIRFHRSFSI